MSCVSLVLLLVAGRGVRKLHPRYIMRAYLDVPATWHHRNVAVVEKLAVTFPSLAVMEHAKV